MNKNVIVPKLFVVLQNGATSGEQYLHAFNRQKDAARFKKRARRASYECSTPLEVPVPEIRTLTEELAKTVLWLRRMGFRGTPRERSLKRALSNLPAGLKKQLRQSES